MNNNQPTEKSLMWYFHPNEIVRLMRVKLYDDVSKDSNFTPLYNKDNLKIGVVIGTNGSVPYIDLALHFLIEVNGIKNILIHDDGSNVLNKLQELANNYNIKCGSNIQVYSTGKNLWHKSCIGSIGDQNCFAIGLQWAKQNNFDILLKFSRRLIPCYKWIDDFKKLVIDSDGITFSSYCKKDKFPIRTELIGMNVKAWSNNYILMAYTWFIQNEYPIFAEFLMDQFAKVLDYYNYSKKYEKWKQEHRNGFLTSGYVHWYDILGTNRYTNEDRKNNKILWHMFKKEEDYLKISKEIFGNKYTLEDFKNIVNI